MSTPAPVHLRRCIVCDRHTETDFGSPAQGSGATAFTTYGHHGSTSFDPMDGSMLSLFVCDPCLVQRASRVMVCTAPEAKHPEWERWKPDEGTTEWVAEQARNATVACGIERTLPDGTTVLVIGDTDDGSAVLVDLDGERAEVGPDDMLGPWRIISICRSYQVNHDWHLPVPTMTLVRED